MRGRVNNRQKIWISKVQEEKSGPDTIDVYSPLICKKLGVSATSGTPEELAAGIVPTYDRYITNYDNSFTIEEGMAIWVDKIPKMNEKGNLVLLSDGYTPETPPDYRITKILHTKKGNVSRYGLVKNGGVF